MTGYDMGALIIAVRATLPTSKLKTFEETLYRAALSPLASDDLRMAAGVEPRPRFDRFEVIQGGRDPEAA
jgi:hypothetical protein